MTKAATKVAVATVVFGGLNAFIVALVANKLRPVIAGFLGGLKLIHSLKN